jgi:ISXO2-like transposase domain/Transposase zinc-ribbon domain
MIYLTRPQFKAIILFMENEMKTEPTSLHEAIIYFSNPDSCVQYIAERRWPNGVICPMCGSIKVSAFNATRRTWKCGSHHPRREFSVKVGTIYEDSPIALDKWLAAIWMLTNCKNGVSSYEIARDLKVTQKTAWFMLHRIRLALGEAPEGKMGGQGRGPVEVDETFVGAIPDRMHHSRRLKLQTAITQQTHKTPMGMLDRETRQVRAHVIPNVKCETLQNAILNQFHDGTAIYTDQYTGYGRFPAAKEFVHETVNHMQEYVRGQVHTQGIENFWSLLKRSLRGTYVAVEPFHLDRYVSEQVFRFNNRATRDNPLNDADRFDIAVRQIVGKHITFAELTGKPN